MTYEAFFKLSYGLYLISSATNDTQSGYIANTAFQVTAEPPQIAISCNKDNLTASVIAESKNFAISVLAQDTDAALIGLFGYKSGKEVDKFEAVAYKTGMSGAPIVTQDAVAWFDCRVVQTVDTGSHLLFIGEIIDNELLAPAGEPLTYAYYHKVKKGLSPKNAPTYIDKSKLEAETPEAADTDDTSGQYKCSVCGHVYDPEVGDPDNGIAPGTPFTEIPDDWSCPVCSVMKDMFDAC